MPAPITLTELETKKEGGGWVRCSGGFFWNKNVAGGKQLTLPFGNWDGPMAAVTCCHDNVIIRGPLGGREEGRRDENTD